MDPKNPNLEPNMELIGAPFARNLPLNYTVTLKLNWGSGSLKVIKVAPFDRLHTTLYLSTVVNMLLSIPFPDIAACWWKIATPFVFGAPVRSKAARFKQQPLMTKLEWWAYQTLKEF